jgi:hypothetical protein
MDKNVADNRARQGPKGRPVLMVLLGSAVLLAIYMTSLIVWSGKESPPSPSQAASQAQNSGGASGANTSAVPAANPAYPAPAVNAASPRQ